MELLYIWVEDYKNIREQGFNLSSKYKFEFSENILHLVSEKTIIFDFSKKGKVRVKDIIAVVGRNGSGKSNLLEIIQKSYYLEMENSIYVFQKDGKFLVLDTRISKGGLTFADEIHIKSRMVSKETIEEYISSSRVIFYSPIVDNSYVSIRRDKDTFNMSESKENILLDISSSLLKPSLDLAKEDLISLLNYLNNSRLFRGNRPEKLVIKSKNLPKIMNVDVRLINETHIEFLIIIILKSLEYSLDEYQQSYLRGIMYDILAWYMVDKNDEKVKYISSLNIKKDEDSEGKKLLSNILHSELFNKDNQLNNIIEIAKFIMTKYKINKERGLRPNPRSTISSEIDLKLNEELSFFLKLLENLCQSLNKNLNDFFNFEIFPILSSGEKAYAQMYSRLYNTLKEVSKKDLSEVLVLIDEGELYLHPEWQRDFIARLLDFLETLKGLYGQSNFTFKIILTSHSPFIVADLPKENIIKMDNGQAGIFSENTFASNIHSLYKTNFFLDSTFGEFSLSKIKSVAKDLTKKRGNPLLESRLREIKTIIDAISEPIIRNNLDSLYLNYVSKVKKEENTFSEFSKLSQEELFNMYKTYKNQEDKK